MTPQKSLTHRVPIGPQEIIEQTHEAYEIGITIAHLITKLNWFFLLRNKPY